MTFRGDRFSKSLRFSSASWSSTLIISPHRSKTTTSSLPKRVRVVVTRSFPAVPVRPATFICSNSPVIRSPKGLLAATSPFPFWHLGQMRSFGEE